MQNSLENKVKRRIRKIPFINRGLIKLGLASTLPFSLGLPCLPLPPHVGWPDAGDIQGASEAVQTLVDVIEEVETPGSVVSEDQIEDVVITTRKIEASESAYRSWENQDTIYAIEDPQRLILSESYSPYDYNDVYIQFLLSGLQGSEILNAKLVMTLNPEASRQSSGPITTELFATDEPFDDLEFSWNHSVFVSDLTPNSLYTHSENRPGQELTWDLMNLQIDDNRRITNLMEYWVNNPDKVYGFAILLPQGNGEYRTFSRNSTKPYLLLEVTPKGTNLKR